MVTVQGLWLAAFLEVLLFVRSVLYLFPLIQEVYPMSFCRKVTLFLCFCMRDTYLEAEQQFINQFNKFNLNDDIIDFNNI